MFEKHIAVAKTAWKAHSKGIAGMDNLILGFVVLAIIIGVGLTVLTNFQDSLDNTSTAYTAVGDLIQDIADNIALIGVILIVGVAATILVLIRGALGGAAR